MHVAEQEPKTKSYILLGSPAHDARRLRVVFSSPDDFSREYAAHLSRGQMFVPGDSSADTLSVGDDVRLSIDLDYTGVTLVVAGRVAETPASGAAAGDGVLVNVELDSDQARETFGALISGRTPNAHPPPPERRAAPRVDAELIATVVSQDERQISGKTRNLSSSGVLVSVLGESVPIGEAVDLMLRCSDSGEEITLPADVVRHVEEGGKVVALGIRFASLDQAEAETQQFLQRQLALEQERQSGTGISGAVDELGLANLLQTFSSISKEGTLKVQNGPEEGCITFSHGQLFDARVGPVTGRKALVRMLAWPGGSFEFRARVDLTFASETAHSLDAVLLDSLRLLDELSRIDLSRFPARATVARVSDDEGNAADSPTLGLDEQETSILQLCGGTVQQILDGVDAPDPEVYLGLERLLDENLIAIER